ncbi:Mismatch repair protein msh3 [Dinochytrium kinnereticum]|nr:Mismatch repair protein msh3 [Dinochytrium kinnereticum]
MNLDGDGLSASNKRQISGDLETSAKKSRFSKPPAAKKPTGPPSGQRTISSFFQKKDSGAVKKPAVDLNGNAGERLKGFASTETSPVKNGKGVSSRQASPLKHAMAISSEEPARLKTMDKKPSPKRTLSAAIESEDDEMVIKQKKKSRRVIEDKDEDEEMDEASGKAEEKESGLDLFRSNAHVSQEAGNDGNDSAKVKLRERFLKRFDISQPSEEESGGREEESEENFMSRMHAETVSRKGARGIKYTPLEQQYLDVKKKYPDCLLVVEVGYKFRFFEEDALTASKILNIVAYKDKNMYGASIPTQRLNVHVKKLVQLGYKAAGDNKSAPFQRKLTNIYTRGTYMDDLDSEDTLFEAQPSYLMCLFEEPAKDNVDRMNIAMLAVQLGAGDIVYDSFVDGSMRSELETRLHHLSPAEILLPLDKLSPLTERSIEFWSTRAGPDGEVVRVERIKDGFPEAGEARQRLHEFYDNAKKATSSSSSTKDLYHSILTLPDSVTVCLCALMNYLSEFHLDHVLHLSQSFNSFASVGNMILSGTAMEQLEIYRAAGEAEERGNKGSLVWILDHTVTKFGGRLLRKWIGKPLVDAGKLNLRIDAVEELLKLLEDGDAHIKKFKGVLSQLPDLEKALSRVHLGRISPSELYNFLLSLEKASVCFTDFGKKVSSSLLQDIFQTLPTIKMKCQEYLLQINEKAAKSDNRQDLFSDEDKYTDIKEFKKEIEDIKERLREILEDTKKQLKRSDLQYVTVAGVEEIRNLEYVREQLGAASEKAFLSFAQEVSEAYEEFKQAIHQIAVFDCLLSLAKVAGQPGYVKPTIVQEPVIEVTDARHPIVESLISSYVSNDIKLNPDERCLLITGPNMGGKSSYIRQVALIAIMGQIGSYVPASSAKLGIFDAVFTRMGACDDISKGQSTFMKELQETSDILRQATNRSLVILDELGRGTSTHDGTAIAYATLRHMLTTVKCTTLFVTHYPTLGSLSSAFSPALKCCHMGFMEHKDDESTSITFLYKLTMGLANRSYGLNVARLASLPADVIDTAKTQSERLENSNADHRQQAIIRLQKRLFAELWGDAPAVDLFDVVQSLDKSKFQKVRMNELNGADAHKLEVRQPNCPHRSLMLAKGNRYFAAGRYEDAISEYSKAIIKNPSNPVYFTNRANCFFKLEKYQSCIADCEKAAQLDSKSVKAFYQWAKSLVELKQFNEALACLKKAYHLGIEQKVPYIEEIASQLRKTKGKQWEIRDKLRRETNSDLYRYMSKLIERDRERQKAQLSQDDRQSRDEVDQIFDDRLSQMTALLSVADEEGKKREVPEPFLGKISFEVMTDPVITPAGITYDRTEILSHLRKIGSWDPLARIPMTEKDLIPNLALKEMIDAFLEENGWAADY